MILYKQSGLAIYFGDKGESFVPGQFYGLKDSKMFLEEGPFAQAFAGAKKALDLQDLALVRQTHGVEGLIVAKMREYMPYEHEGDYLITNIPHVGLGITTADCLPIVFYDPMQHVIANAHAGWKGTLAGIAPKVVRDMQKVYDCKPENIQVFLGLLRACVVMKLDTILYRILI